LFRQRGLHAYGVFRDWRRTDARPASLSAHAFAWGRDSAGADSVQKKKQNFRSRARRAGPWRRKLGHSLKFNITLLIDSS
jgi:hypothetical protein